uniref:C3H1-type domain-containing protein n=1 Tax=Eutreptiella gymnastica TaxID=73025 RepID=A0A7S1IAM8_9EUGL|mmetsp:Transcript_143175/g.249814  ORF Transcript_143175/g.249814 Transcript_143175/m.249814 type:complete len:161 (+) Transcript_143175:101-583(+)
MQSNATEGYRPLSVTVRDEDRHRQTVCRYDGFCTNPECIYRHTGDQGQGRPCVYFLAGTCAFGDECRYQHITPDPELLRRLASKPCLYGLSCPRKDCLFSHGHLSGQVGQVTFSTCARKSHAKRNDRHTNFPHDFKPNPEPLPASTPAPWQSYSQPQGPP